MNIKTASIGMITGFVNGLFGSGGGTLIVPSLEHFLRLDPHRSHATAIAVILPLSLISILIYSRSSLPDILPVVQVSAGGIAGGMIGAKLLHHISSDNLRRIFAIFMIIAGVKMIL